jgi:lipopolysaccharide/colanic/teichoic acid biosynthesis glycosyltransferase
MRIGIVPFGEIETLKEIRSIEWVKISQNTGLEDLRCEAIVADFRAHLSPEWERFLADAALSGTVVYQVKQLRESLTGRVEINYLSENSFGSLIPGALYLKAKSLGDFVSALVVTVALFPLLALVAILVRLDSPGPSIFRQRRVGHRGEPFMVYKFRTMHVSASEPSNEVRHAITTDADPRVTRLGRFLRRSRIDELPQMINILRGEMSWIGPRPEADVLSSWYEAELPFYRYRHIVKPGITGWAQVNQGHVAEMKDVLWKMQYDFYYIKYFSPWLDLLILFRTVQTVITGFGSR